MEFLRRVVKSLLFIGIVLGVGGALVISAGPHANLEDRVSAVVGVYGWRGVLEDERRLVERRHERELYRPRAPLQMHGHGYLDTVLHSVHLSTSASNRLGAGQMTVPRDRKSEQKQDDRGCEGESHSTPPRRIGI